MGNRSTICRSWDVRLFPLFDAAADLLLGSACPGCRRPGLGLCQACVEALSVPAFHLERSLPLPLAAANPYRPLLEHIVPAYKDDGALHLSRFLGRRLASAVQALGPPRGTVLVPAPSVPAAVRRRGFDHTQALAAVAARTLGLTHRRWLRRGRGGADQSILGRGQRRMNLAGAMRAVGGARQSVVIVDDLVTTGATLLEAHRALTAAGARVWGAAVIGDVDDRDAFPLV